MTNETSSRAAQGAWIALAVALVAFHLALVFSGLVPNLVSRPLHMAFILPFALVWRAESRWQKLTGAVLAVLGMGAALWVAWNSNVLIDQYGFLEGPFQTGIAVVLLAVVLEPRAAPSAGRCRWWRFWRCFTGFTDNTFPASSAIPARPWRRSWAR